jgi:septum formation inhibitor MinC
MNFDMSYVLYGLVIAAFAIIIIYFSRVEEEEDTKSKKVLRIEAPNQEVEQLKQRLNEQIMQQDREYQQTLIQVREAENNRRVEYAKQVDNLRNVEAQLIRDKEALLKEKQEFVQEKIESQKGKSTKSHSKKTDT